MVKSSIKTDDSPEDDPNAATITIEFRGQTFEVPKRRGRWPIQAVLQFGLGEPISAFHALLGPDEWQRLTTVAHTLDDFAEFASGAADALNSECIL